MTDDDSTFRPREFKIEFIPRKFIQLTLIEFLISFIFLKFNDIQLSKVHFQKIW